MTVLLRLFLAVDTSKDGKIDVDDFLNTACEYLIVFVSNFKMQSLSYDTW